MTTEKVNIRGRAVPVRETLDDSGRVRLQSLLSDPEDLDRRCRAALLEPTRALGNGDTQLYVRHHLGLMGRTTEELPPVTMTVAEAFVRAMSVRSIWAASEADDEFLHVDYTIDAQGTDYVLSVALDRDGVIRSVRMES